MTYIIAQGRMVWTGRRWSSRYADAARYTDRTRADALAARLGGDTETYRDDKAPLALL